MDRKQLKRLLLLLLCLCLLAGCGKKDEEEDPEDGEEAGSELLAEYTVGDQTVAALSTEESGVSVDTLVTYTYSGLSDTGKAAAGYASQLQGEESGFSIVDEEYVRCDGPDYTQPEGQVLLAKNIEASAAAEGGGGGESAAPAAPVNQVLYVRISWDEEACTVAADTAEGRVTSPPPPPAGMSLVEAQDYLAGLSPAVLGLTGESMEEYTIYTMNGAVLVDGNPCIRMNVYSSDNPQHTNELAACFLMNGNGTHLYRLDPETNTVEELDVVRGR